jgi:hypothetical protein
MRAPILPFLKAVHSQTNNLVTGFLEFRKNHRPVLLQEGIFCKVILHLLQVFFLIGLNKFGYPVPLSCRLERFCFL